MRSYVSSVLGMLAIVLTPCAAAARGVASSPLSHPSGFQKVECHIVNVGTRDLVVDRFVIEDVNSSTSFGSSASGSCTGLPPWTVPPGRGCSRSLILVSACTQPNACFCQADFSGSAKNVRGNFIGTINASTLSLTSDLK